jgi:hypothetical protein
VCVFFFDLCWCFASRTKSKCRIRRTTTKARLFLVPSWLPGDTRIASSFVSLIVILFSLSYCCVFVETPHNGTQQRPNNRTATTIEQLRRRQRRKRREHRRRLRSRRLAASTRRSCVGSANGKSMRTSFRKVCVFICRVRRGRVLRKQTNKRQTQSGFGARLVVSALQLAADVTPHLTWRNGIELSLACRSPDKQSSSSSSAFRFYAALVFDVSAQDECALSLDTYCVELQSSSTT